MSAETKAEAAPLRAFKHKTIGHRVCRRVTIGGRQHHQEGIPGLQHAVTDDTPIGNKPPSVLHWGIEARHFFNQRHDLGGRVLNLLQQIRLPGEHHQCVTYQAGRGFAGL